MRFLDTNIIVDVLGSTGSIDSASARWSVGRYGDALEMGAVVCNLVVLAELTGRARDPATILDALTDHEIDLLDITPAAAFHAGQAFRLYRQRGGPRQAILPDFLIAGHAASAGATLVTRDRRLQSYFPDLSLITPDTHP